MKTIPLTLPVLFTERLVLRAMAESDREDLYAIYGDAQTMQFASDPVFPSVETVITMLKSVQLLLDTAKSLEWGIEKRETHRLIGTCGLFDFNHGDSSAQIGCMLSRTEWGCGFMHEALGRVIEFSYSELEIDIVRADVDPQNVKSMKLFERLGFQPVDNLLVRQIGVVIP